MLIYVYHKGLLVLLRQVRNNLNISRAFSPAREKRAYTIAKISRCRNTFSFYVLAKIIYAKQFSKRKVKKSTERHKGLEEDNRSSSVSFILRATGYVRCRFAKFVHYILSSMTIFQAAFAFDCRYVTSNLNRDSRYNI